jgi:tetratricopeptide (TPR) repeat protein
MYDRAIEALYNAITLEPGNPVTYNNRGLTYTNSGQYNKAIEDFSRAILLDKNYADAFFYRGDAYFRLGNKERAISDFQIACTLGISDACSALADHGP